METVKRVCVLGGGSWGATIATHLALKGTAVSLWEYFEKQAEQMQKSRTLSFFPQLEIPPAVRITSQMTEALEGAEIIFSVVPSQFVRTTWQAVRRYNPALKMAVTLTKGIEEKSLKRMSEIIAEEFPEAKEKIAAVSGPSHAEEVARGLPCAVVASSPQREIAEKTQELLTSDNFRVYINPDIIGVEIAGALKNIFAIACGACDGLGLGDNTKSALITRGLNEMTKLGTRMGAQLATFFGLAGMGDLVVTCFSKHSRNRLLGQKIGEGKSMEQALKEMTMVAEGAVTVRSAASLVEKFNCNCPIISEIYKALYENKSAKEVMRDLLQRPAHEESKELIWN